MSAPTPPKLKQGQLCVWSSFFVDGSRDVCESQATGWAAMRPCTTKLWKPGAMDVWQSLPSCGQHGKHFEQTGVEDA